MNLREIAGVVRRILAIRAATREEREIRLQKAVTYCRRA